jgi:twitching motility protein PilT
MTTVLDRVLQAARQLGASDVHMKAGLPPIFRIKGELRTVKDVPPLSREALRNFANSIMSERLRQQFEQTWDVDLSYASQDGVRYRVNAFQQRGAVGLVMRLIPPDVPPFETLNLPVKVLELASEARGLVLVTGITGSGKSTTLAAMVDYINSKRAAHIITIEDPVEFSFKDRRSVINQREVGFDTTSFSRALRAALRQDPDVVLVGEMRDLETTEIALTAAETGHLVLSTLHTIDAVETVNRIISLYPPHQQGQARLQLQTVLRGVVSQRLIPRADGRGMIPACEILINTAGLKNSLRMRSARGDSRCHQHRAKPLRMMSFDQSLTELVQRQIITYEEAVANASNPDDFALFFRGFNKSGSSLGGPKAKSMRRTSTIPTPRMGTFRKHRCAKSPPRGWRRIRCPATST